MTLLFPHGSITLSFENSLYLEPGNSTYGKLSEVKTDSGLGRQI
jgi:hypothetical protein